MNAPINAPLAAQPVLAHTARVPCLIVNPKSFRASRGGLATRASTLGRAHGAEVVENADPAVLAAAMDAQLARGQRRFFVLAGDGTVQALVDHLARTGWDGASGVQLLLLGGGRTNLIAADLGGCGAPLEKLERAFRRCADGEAPSIETRTLLAVEQSPAPPRHGLFVAGGLVDDAIRDCHAFRAKHRGALARGPLSTFFYLLRLLVLALIGRNPLRTPHMQTDAGTLGRLDAPTRILIAATLEHRGRWLSPYAARGQGPLRLTAIAANAARFWRCLPRIVTGRFDARLDLARGYLSGRCERVEVLGMRGYSLDGEDFDTDPSRPVTIRAASSMHFIRP